MTETFDTSGCVQCLAPDQKPNESTGCRFWSDLTPFEQGYVKRLFEELSERIKAVLKPGLNSVRPAFSGLDPSALEMIREDCAKCLAAGYTNSEEAGRWCWRAQNNNTYPKPAGLNPVASSLNGPGLVCLASQPRGEPA